MENKQGLLFAILKSKQHLGNTRSNSQQNAIYTFLIDSGYSREDLIDNRLVAKYEAILAIKGLHF